MKWNHKWNIFLINCTIFIFLQKIHPQLYIILKVIRTTLGFTQIKLWISQYYPQSPSAWKLNRPSKPSDAPICLISLRPGLFWYNFKYWPKTKSLPKLDRCCFCLSLTIFLWKDSRFKKRENPFFQIALHFNRKAALKSSSKFIRPCLITVTCCCSFLHHLRAP